MKQSALNRQRLGKLGEDVAVELLKRKGYLILARNFRVPSGELDIVVRKGSLVVAVEVKTRSDNSFGRPEEVVTPVKIRRIEKAFAYFLLKHGISGCPLRIDVVAIFMTPDGRCTDVQHLENVSG